MMTNASHQAVSAGEWQTAGTLKCEGKIIHGGGRIATAEGRVWGETGTLIAHGTEIWRVMTAPSTSS